MSLLFYMMVVIVNSAIRSTKNRSSPNDQPTGCFALNTKHTMNIHTEFSTPNLDSASEMSLGNVRNIADS